MPRAFSPFLSELYPRTFALSQLPTTVFPTVDTNSALFSTSGFHPSSSSLNLAPLPSIDYSSMASLSSSRHAPQPLSGRLPTDIQNGMTELLCDSEGTLTETPINGNDGPVIRAVKAIGGNFNPSVRPFPSLTPALHLFVTF